MIPSELAGRIDHTMLKPEASSAEVHRAVAEAIEHRCAAVCIAPAWLARAATMLRGSGVRACTVVGFPHGTSKSTIKAIEASSAVKDGADEIDVVAFLPNLIRGDFEAARAELMEIVRASRAARPNVIIKVIIESALLLAEGVDKGEQSIALACRAVRESGCDFVKTSTGFHPAGGASPEAVQLIKKHGQGLSIKAAGGIRDWKTAEAMLAAGADRLGMSLTVHVLREVATIGGSLNR